MKSLPHIKELLLRFSFLVLIYTLIRFAFYFMNMNLFHDISLNEWFIIFFQGIRFDITILIYINALVILLQSIPFKFRENRIYNSIQKYLYVGCNLIGIVIALSDVAFYKFNSKRIDSEVLGLIGTLPTMLGSFLVDYWYLVTLLCILIYTLFKIYQLTTFLPNNGKPYYTKNSIAFICISGLCVLGLRGGIQNKPIRPVMASGLIRVELAPLITNSPYTFFYSLINRNLKKKNYFSEQELDFLFPIKKKITSHKLNNTKVSPNIVYIILESFSKEFIGHLNEGNGFTPNLDSISQHSLVFSNAFANSRRSSQALVALTAGLPALMDDPYMYSPYLDNKIYGLPQLLKKIGYSTSFFNGSRKEMLGWQNFIGQVGFEDYYSQEDYPKPKHYDGHWGIYDHYFLDFFIEKISSFQTPFFTSFFTISSHHPYLIPDEYQSTFTGNGDFINSLQYTDWAIGQFFKKAKNQPWFDNTIFIITADHTNGAAFVSPDQNELNNKNNNRVGIYSIPTLIYAPKLIAPNIIDEPIQQLDLFDTSLDLADYTGNYYSFGNSVFSEDVGLSVQYVNGIYQLIKGDYVLLFKEDKPTHLFNYKIDPLLSNNLIKQNPALDEEMTIKLKAIIQQYHKVLIENTMKL